VSKRIKNTASTITINVQRIGHRGRRIKKNKRCYNQVQESKDAKAKEKLRKETLCGRLDRTINYAREIKYHIQIC
jgi:hypothetical protein